MVLIFVLVGTYEQVLSSSFIVLAFVLAFFGGGVFFFFFFFPGKRFSLGVGLFVFFFPGGGAQGNPGRCGVWWKDRQVMRESEFSCTL